MCFNIINYGFCNNCSEKCLDNDWTILRNIVPVEPYYRFCVCFHPRSVLTKTHLRQEGKGAR